MDTPTEGARRSCCRTWLRQNCSGRSTDSASGEPSHLSVRLLKVEAHVHLAVHRRRGGEVLPRLLVLARAPVELAEAEVAVGDERAHAAGFGECECIKIVRLA